jgi:hypothetical protein
MAWPPEMHVMSESGLSVDGPRAAVHADSCLQRSATLRSGNMPDEETVQIDRHQQKVNELRAAAAQLLAELDKYQAGESDSFTSFVPPAKTQSARSLDIQAEPAADAITAGATGTGQPIIAGEANTATDTTYLTNTDNDNALYASGGGGVVGVGRTYGGVAGISYGGDGVSGLATGSSGGSGVSGRANNTGVYGEAAVGNGVYGYSSAGNGIYGYSQDRLGTAGVSVNGIGVLAFSRQREALNASSIDGDGVRAHTSSGFGAAVFAENSSGASGGHGVVALGQSGIGLYASGEHAPVQLGRAQTAGAPTGGFHVAGELFLDANADLYLCKANGTPGTWKLIG